MSSGYDEKPPRIKPRITAAPKIRQIYWCEYWHDARLPEMWKTRPVVVVSYKNNLHGICLVIPFSSEPQKDQEWTFPISIEVEKGKISWAICNHPTTVSASRFTPSHGNIPLLPIEDFNRMLEKLNKWLPQPFKPKD